MSAAPRGRDKRQTGYDPERRHSWKQSRGQRPGAAIRRVLRRDGAWKCEIRHRGCVVISPTGVQTSVMVDVRKPALVVASLREAPERFEKGGTVPVAVSRLLGEVADALADSGPLELGVSPRRWLRAQARANPYLDTDVCKQCRHAKRALRRLHGAVISVGWAARWAARNIRSWRARPRLAIGGQVLSTSPRPPPEPRPDESPDTPPPNGRRSRDAGAR